MSVLISPRCRVEGTDMQLRQRAAICAPGTAAPAPRWSTPRRPPTPRWSGHRRNGARHPPGHAASGRTPHSATRPAIRLSMKRCGLPVANSGNARPSHTASSPHRNGISDRDCRYRSHSPGHESRAPDTLPEQPPARHRRPRRSGSRAFSWAAAPPPRLPARSSAAISGNRTENIVAQNWLSGANSSSRIAATRWLSPIRTPQTGIKLMRDPVGQRCQ